MLSRLAAVYLCVDRWKRLHLTGTLRLTSRIEKDPAMKNLTTIPQKSMKEATIDTDDAVWHSQNSVIHFEEWFSASPQYCSGQAVYYNHEG